MSNKEITVKGLDVKYKKIDKEDYISHRFGALCKSDRTESSDCHMDA